jgi:hypothetical protein
VPYFVVFRTATGRWVARGPFRNRAAAEAGRPPSADADPSLPPQVVEAAHGTEAAHIVFRSLNLPGYRSGPAQQGDADDAEA